MPIGVLCTRYELLDFELVVEWRHLKSAGNFGAVVWVPMKALDGLPPDALPMGASRSTCSSTATAGAFANGTPPKPNNWFTTNGDIFRVGNPTLEFHNIYVRELP